MRYRGKRSRYDEWQFVKPYLAQFDTQDLFFGPKSNIGCSQAIEPFLNGPLLVAATMSRKFLRGMFDIGFPFTAGQGGAMSDLLAGF